jgi:hypothetical protein
MNFNDVTSRQRTRVCFSYGLTPRLPVTVPAKCIGESYDFGRLAKHVYSGRDLLPRVLIDKQLVPSDPGPPEPPALSLFPSMYALRITLTITPRGGGVLIIDGELAEPLTPQELAELLAVTCFERENIKIDELPILDWILQELRQIGVYLDTLEFGLDVHQCVFPGNSLQDKLRIQENPSEINRIASEILYRGTVPVDAGSLLGINVPQGLNNPGNTFVAHGRGVSLFSGWTKPLEHAFVLTAISTVSALGALRLSRHEAFAAMALAQDANLASAQNARTLVSKLSDRLNEMQLDLSFGVETHIDSILIPEMVIEGFQRSLSEAVGIRESLENTSRMLQRVGAVISARLSKLTAGDRERIERRDRLVAILIGVASLLALPPALLLAFFGIEAPQVHPADSIFDFHAYWSAYALAWLPFVILVVVGGILYSRIRRHGASLDTGVRKAAE